MKPQQNTHLHLHAVEQRIITEITLLINRPHEHLAITTKPFVVVSTTGFVRMICLILPPLSSFGTHPAPPLFFKYIFFTRKTSPTTSYVACVMLAFFPPQSLPFSSIQNVLAFASFQCKPVNGNIDKQLQLIYLCIKHVYLKA